MIETQYTAWRAMMALRGTEIRDATFEHLKLTCTDPDYLKNLVVRAAGPPGMTGRQMTTLQQARLAQMFLIKTGAHKEWCGSCYVYAWLSNHIIARLGKWGSEEE